MICRDAVHSRVLLRIVGIPDTAELINRRAHAVYPAPAISAAHTAALVIDEVEFLVSKPSLHQVESFARKLLFFPMRVAGRPKPTYE